MSTREEIRLHLIAAHHWPKVAHYDATAADLDDLHTLMHDRSRTGEAVKRIREILRMPPEAAD